MSNSRRGSVPAYLNGPYTPEYQRLNKIPENDERFSANKPVRNFKVPTQRQPPPQPQRSPQRQQPPQRTAPVSRMPVYVGNNDDVFHNAGFYVDNQEVMIPEEELPPLTPQELLHKEPPQRAEQVTHLELSEQEFDESLRMVRNYPMQRQAQPQRSQPQRSQPQPQPQPQPQQPQQPQQPLPQRPQPESAPQLAAGDFGVFINGECVFASKSVEEVQTMVERLMLDHEIASDDIFVYKRLELNFGITLK